MSITYSIVRQKVRHVAIEMYMVLFGVINNDSLSNNYIYFLKDVVELISPDHPGEIKPEWDLVKSNVSKN